MLRKGHDSLAALVKNELRKDPFTGTVFVFRARKADRLKLLYWDGTGLVMACKRLEEHSFSWPAVKDGLMTLSHAQFEALFAGLDWRRVRAIAARARKLIEITRTGPAPIAEEGVDLIRDLYRIEADIRGSDPTTARLIARQDRSAPILARIDDWLRHHRARASAKSPLGEALAYIARYRDGLRRFLTDGRVEMDSNAVERTIRPIALNRKNALFAGHDAGAENWALIASLIETCKLNSVDPHAWLAATLTAIVTGHKQSQIHDLLPWNYAAKV
ncbi:IS66 family insertion sequence element accessory protein TnpB [Paracoccus sp. MC1862]|uniref:IS66 family insertion sequence element accessory protein TnpB n=1 Tax=Paracoccus sp. MC1862 TaxID=2760307 RepID=UPI0016020D77|nr:IS66 family insertion sequence element accessory protein TnpB [Paracoccus sp. MC1862]QQO43754.1 IS66 family insertion sequence element accessory protein TnpB [Paracoccus sp. MC1862]QQO45042.1 IS66 family insertion sequence element accessory protein TnpB [Paracoccus sp. MC1862]